MFYYVYTNHVGEKTLEKLLSCNIFFKIVKYFFTGILDGSLFLLNLVLKVDFQKKLVDRESLFPSTETWFFGCQYHRMQCDLFFWVYNSMVELFTSTGEGFTFDAMIALFSLASTGKFNSMQ